MPRDPQLQDAIDDVVQAMETVQALAEEIDPKRGLRGGKTNRLLFVYNALERAGQELTREPMDDDVAAQLRKMAAKAARDFVPIDPEVEHA